VDCHALRIVAAYMLGIGVTWIEYVSY